ncbi:unknown [Mycoplasma sp. CAG:877]|nr:unknown [Mycoplasma sp. CAG:877]
MLPLIYFVCFYLSLPGFFAKAGYSPLKGLIPIYNICILCMILKINPVLLIVLGLGLIFLPCRMFVATLIIIFLPFQIADAYSSNFKVSIITFILPIIMYPVLAYIKGYYTY